MFKFVFVLCVVFGALIWGVIVNVLYVFSWIFFGNFFGATYTGLIEYGYEDYTRRMQTFLFKQIIDLIS